MVKLFGRGRKDRNELDAEILEDVDLSAIVEQKRRQQTQSRESMAESEKREVETEARAKTQTVALDTRSVTEIFREEFVEWLVEQALRDNDRYRKLMDLVEYLDVDDLRRLCRILLRKLRES